MNRDGDMDRSVTWPERTALLVRLAARNLARLALGKTRTPEASAEEYGAHWQRLLSEKPWERYATLGEFLVGRYRSGVALVDGAMTRIDARSYYAYKHGVIRDCLAEHARDQVVELGCGWGANLFALHEMRAGWQLAGLDYSLAGVRAGREIAAHFHLPITFGEIDLRSDHAAFSNLQGACVFTHYCLEQVPRDTAAVLARIRASAPHVVLHLEPAYEILGWTPIDIVTWLYIRSQDYQRTLLAELRRMESRREAEIIAVRRMGYAPAPQNFPMFIAWRPAH